MICRLALISVVGFVALWSDGADAQQPTWLADRKYKEGAGFRVGDFELHPAVGADFGYDSNYFLRGSDESPVGSLRLRLSPSFSVSTLGPQRRGEDAPPPSVNFRAGINGTYNEFFPVTGSDADKDALRSERNIGAEFTTNLDIMPRRPWSGRVYGSFGRSLRPTNEGDPNATFNRLLPKAGAELIWTPGGGVLDWRLGYSFAGTIFESGEFSNLNNFHNNISTRGRWRFLPRSALTYDMNAGFVTYPGGTYKTSSYPVRARFGFNGLITSSFGITLLAGWGASFYSGDQDDFDSVLALAELKWYLTPSPSTDPMKVTASLSSVAVGFSRDFDDSYIGTYLERDRGYARFSYLFGGVFLLVADAGVSAVIYPNAPDWGQADGWTDVAVDGKLFAEYRVIDSVGINADIGYRGYFSKTAVTFPNYPNEGTNALDYQQITAFLGARWFM